MVKASRKHRRQQSLLLNSISKPPRPAPGRPPLEDSEEFKELPNLIVRVAMQLAAADPRRRAEIYSIPKTLADLQEELGKQGMIIKKQTFPYNTLFLLRFLNKRSLLLFKTIMIC